MNTCVPSGSFGFWILTGASNNGVKACRTKSLPNLRLTKTEIGLTFCGPAPLVAVGTWRLVASCAPTLDDNGGYVAVVVMLSAATAATWDAGETDTVDFGTKRCGLVTSNGRTSSRAMMTRVPRFVRCQSRTAKLSVNRMQPCDAGYPGKTPFDPTLSQRT